MKRQNKKTPKEEPPSTETSSNEAEVQLHSPAKTVNISIDQLLEMFKKIMKEFQEKSAGIVAQINASKTKLIGGKDFGTSEGISLLEVCHQYHDIINYSQRA